MLQPVSGYSWTHLNQGAGSTVVSAAPVLFHSVLTIGTLGGTVIFHNSPTVAGTSAANKIFTLSQVTNAGTIPYVSELDFSLNSGLVAITSGTVDFVVSTG